MLVSLGPGVDNHLETCLLRMLADLLKHLPRQSFQVEMRDRDGLAVPRQIQKHVLVSKALTVLVLDERITV